MREHHRSGSLSFEAPSIWKVPSFQLKRVTSTQQVYFETILNIQKMGLKKNGKKVRIAPHESVNSEDSLEMDEFSDEEDEVFVRHDSEEAGKPLIRKKKKVKPNHT